MPTMSLTEALRNTSESFADLHKASVGDLPERKKSLIQPNTLQGNKLCTAFAKQEVLQMSFIVSIDRCD